MVSAESNHAPAKARPLQVVDENVSTRLTLNPKLTKMRPMEIALRVNSLLYQMQLALRLLKHACHVSLPLLPTRSWG